MELSTFPPELLVVFTEIPTVSVTPLNVSVSEDLLQTNDTQSSSSRDTAGLVLAVSITALYSLICVVGLLGNVLVMYGVVR